MIGSFCLSSGLISEYGVFTFAASFSTSASGASSVYVTQTAPCSSECTAFSFSQRLGVDVAVAVHPDLVVVAADRGLGRVGRPSW